MWRWLVVSLAAVAWGPAAASPAVSPGDAYSRYDGEEPEVPLHVESRVGKRTARGISEGVLPFDVQSLAEALEDPRAWCEITFMHTNVKGCAAPAAESDRRLRIYLGGKRHEDLKDAHAIDFRFQVVERSDNYLHVRLRANDGPYGTSGHAVDVEAMPLSDGRSRIRLRYSFGFGWFGRLAMETYFATLGRNKVGFSVVARGARGEPVYVGGMQGLVERNAMRYYLALETYLATLELPPGDRFEARIQRWFQRTQDYAAQLGDTDRQDYLEAKRRERNRSDAALQLADGNDP